MASATRARKLRCAMGYGKWGGVKGFAAFLCVSGTRWNNVETGKQPLSRLTADILVRKCPGITRDWLYDGKIAGLSLEWQMRLEI